MIIPTNRKKLVNKKAEGFTLDAHTRPSRPEEQDEMGSPFYVRTPMGKALFKLKYRNDQSKIDDIAETVANFLEKDWQISDHVDVIVPALPSDLTRDLQPVWAIADRIGILLGIPVSYGDVVKKKVTQQIKNIINQEERRHVLSGAFSIITENLTGKHVLLFDDLLGSGATLRALVDILYEEGKVNKVSVLTLTHTHRETL